MFQVQNQVILAWFSTLLALVVSVLERVMKFWPEFFLTLFYVKQLKSTQNMMFGSFGDKTMSFWVGLQVWRVFVSKVMKFWSKHFLAALMGKKQENNQKWGEEGFGTKPSHLGLFYNFGRLSCQKLCNFNWNFFKSY